VSDVISSLNEDERIPSLSYVWMGETTWSEKCGKDGKA
jgi:hypothetical protein